MRAIRLPALAALAASATLAPAAVAQAQQPTLQFGQPCYADGQPADFTGSGYTPGGEVDMLFSLPGDPRGGFDVTADPVGAIAGAPPAREDVLLRDDETRETIFVTANDRTRIDAGAPPESQFGAAQFTFTRWAGFSPGRYVPGRKVRVEIYGWAFAEGERAYFLFRKGSRTVASVRIGTLAGPCGDRKARVRVPRNLKAGAYKVWLSTDRRKPSDRSTWRRARVAGRSSASVARLAPMRRVG